MEVNKSISEDASEKGLYELAYLLEPSVGESDVPARAGDLGAIIERLEGIVNISDNPKLRKLAYTIARSLGGRRQKYSQAYFGWIKFSAPAASIPLIDKEIKGLSFVVRYMLIRAVKVVPRVPRRIIAHKSEGLDAVVKPSVEEIDKEVESLIASASAGVPA